MTVRLSKRLLCHWASIAASVALVAGLSATTGSAQPTGIGQLGDALPHSRALRVLRQMQRDSVRVDSRHWQAAQRCDRAAMAQLQRQLDDLAAQARNVIRNSGLVNDTSGNAIEADRIAENIEIRARHASSRQPTNCGGTAIEEPGGTSGSMGGLQSSGEQLVELQKESVGLNGLHYQAAERCDRAEMARLQAELDRLADEAGRIMRDAAIGPRGTGSARFRNAERIAHNIAARADEARKRQPKNCPEQMPQQGDRTGSPATGSTPKPQTDPLPEQDPPPEPDAPPPEQDAPPSEEDPPPPG